MCAYSFFPLLYAILFPSLYSTAIECPKVEDQKEEKTSVVLVTYKSDSCRAANLVKSLLKYDICSTLNPILVVWNDKWSFVPGKKSIVKDEYMNQIQNLGKIRNVTITLVKPWGKKGERSWWYWGGQQLGKLMISRIITTKYYLVLDSKNMLIAPLFKHDLYNECGVARKMGYGINQSDIMKMYEDMKIKNISSKNDCMKFHNNNINFIWICKTIAALYQSNYPKQLFSSYFPWHNSITPAMLHTDSVRKLIHHFIPSFNKR